MIFVVIGARRTIMLLMNAGGCSMKDLTTGSPLKKILMFCWPLLLGNLFQQFYNLADSIIVGKYLGVSAFASVGSTGSLNFLIIGFATGACAGCAIPVA